MMSPINKIFLLLAILLLPLLSCKTSDNQGKLICDTANPLQDLPWLKEIKKAMEMNMRAAGGQIIRYSYKGNDVFWIDPCHGCADDLIYVYNCQGEVICEFGGIAGLNTCIDFHSEASDSTMLFNGVQQLGVVSR
jgi:hypothetical protein